MMRPPFVVRLNALFVAMALILAAAQAAEPSPLIGLTREQLVERYGEPRSQIVAGNRVVLFFARERVVLRDGVVVEVERLPAEQPRPAPAAPPTAAAETQTPAGDTATAPAPSTQPGTAPAASAPGATTKAGSTPSQPETPSAPPEPKFEIKSVRPPGSAPRQQPKQEPPPAAKAEPAPVATTTPPRSTPVASTPMPKATPTPAPGPTAPGASSVAIIPPPATREESKAGPTPAETEKTPAEKKAKAEKTLVRRSPAEPEIPGTAEIIGSKRNYFITFLVVVSGVGYLYWRYRQRQLALAATAVSHAPFSAPVAAKIGGVVFNNELLQKLEWKRFEELVASYYSKTGVIAMRTKSGPNAPVHIKISWKGEPRPFAYVQCIAHPVGLIDANPLQELVNILAAEDIRRGYVVSTGKFSVGARDLAEEKHLTLLPGDIFLEKLNALPDAARSELMQQTTTGDYTTPSCPKCDAKMVKSPEDPAMWHCPNHPEQRLPVR